jgi:hypothetical protein
MTGRQPVWLALLAEVAVMAAVSIRILDDTARERLRVRAIAHGRSMEADMRAILAESVRQPSLCVVMTDGQLHSAYVRN